MTTSFYRKVHQFPVVLHEDEGGGYWVSCPLLEGCYSQGETMEEALENIREAIMLCLEDLPKQKVSKQLKNQVSLHLVTV